MESISEDANFYSRSYFDVDIPPENICFAFVIMQLEKLYKRTKVQFLFYNKQQFLSDLNHLFEDIGGMFLQITNFRVQPSASAPPAE